jgi:hypothetical protein
MSKILEKLGITDGPWEEQGNDVIAGPCYDMVCNWVSSTANEKLICAAPEILEALIQDVLEEEEQAYERYPMAMDDQILDTLDKKKIKLIEKATGKTWEEIEELLDE